MIRFGSETEKIARIIRENAGLQDPDILKKMIDQDVASQFKEWMTEGVRYYGSEHDIEGRKITFKVDEETLTDPNRANNKLVHSYHRFAVDQKVSYVVGNPVTITARNIDVTRDVEVISKDKDGKEQKRVEKVTSQEAPDISRLDQWLKTDRFNDVLSEWAEGSSNKGCEFVHPFINRYSELDFCITWAEQIIPIYDPIYENDLIELIRYYPVEYKDAQEESQTRYHAEWWTRDSVTYYIQTKDGKFVEDPNRRGPQPHFSFTNTATGKVKGHSWGRVPFIKLRNNRHEITDLRPVKTLIDDYDLNRSDSSNNLSDVAEAIMIFIGLGGMDLSEAVKNLKTKKAIKLSADDKSDFRTETIDIPSEAREKHLDRLEKDIMRFSMAVDMNPENFGEMTGIAIKLRYGILDLKANRLIGQMKLALREFMWFLCYWLKNHAATKADIDPDVIEFTFNKQIPVNLAEAIENAQKSKGIISDETILKNHPWVDDVEEEMARLAAQDEPIDLNDPNDPGNNE